MIKNISKSGKIIPKSSNITLKQNIKEVLEDRWQNKELENIKNSETFGSYVNDILQGSIDIQNIYGENIFNIMKSDVKIFLKFFQLAENIKNEKEVIRKSYYTNMEQNLSNLITLRKNTTGKAVTQSELNILIQSFF